MDMQKLHSGSRLDNSALTHQASGYKGSELLVTNFSVAPIQRAGLDELMTLFMNNTTTRQLSKEIVQYNSLAVLGALAYKAHAHWQSDSPLSELTAITGHDITQASPLPQFVNQVSDFDKRALKTSLMKAMIAAFTIQQEAAALEKDQLLKSAQQLGLDDKECDFIHELMTREVTVQEISYTISTDKRKAVVYLAAYLGVRGDSLLERKFLEDLATTMGIPNGLTAYLQRQANLGIAKKH